LHNTRTGVAHHLAADERDAIVYARRLLGYLPGNNRETAPTVEAPLPGPPGPIAAELTPRDLELDTLMPDSPRQAYDVHEILARVLDDGDLLEVQPLFAPNIVIGFGRVDGRSVGVVANQPARFAGCLNIDASEKAARFVRTCDSFNVPVLTFVDVPGFLPGTDQEWNGLIRHGAKLIYAYGEATVPKITVITRKAYGGAYGVMGSKHLGADVNLAWPTAQVAVTGAAGAVSVLYQRELAGLDEAQQEARRAQLQQEYEDLADPYRAAERGYVDAVIPPSHTRGHVSRALRLHAGKRVAAPERKHGNIPL
jgi:propionyl-CoA carboxylase beta chain